MKIKHLLQAFYLNFKKIVKFEIFNGFLFKFAILKFKKKTVETQKPLAVIRKTDTYCVEFLGFSKLFTTLTKSLKMRLMMMSSNGMKIATTPVLMRMMMMYFCFSL